MNRRKSSTISSQQSVSHGHNLRSKRRGEDMRSPEKKSAKRPVLNDININSDAVVVVTNKKNPVLKTKKKSAASSRQDVGENKENAESSDKNDAVVKKAASEVEKNSSVQKVQNDETLYVSAFEELNHGEEETKNEPKPETGEKMMKDLQNGSHYALEIFNYMKVREKHFQIDDYMPRQLFLTRNMRSLLIDWMVEVQQIFNLHHETLYLAVKITDIYLSKKIIHKEILQLIGIATLLISSKYDERKPILIDDFLYLCNYAYTKRDIIRKEIDVFRAVGCNLCIPLSYRFLQRYGKCCGTPNFTFTLARYILESSLLEYHFILELESKLASAALFLALKMTDLGSWTTKLEYYSGYKIFEFVNIVVHLNIMLHKKPNENMRAIRTKYSRKHLFDITRVPLIDEFFI